jgi:hypothetical protein
MSDPLSTPRPAPLAAVAMNCPRCTAPMRPLRLSSHRHEAVTVDHCPDCRLVWFDRLESVQLDALGWVRLLRTMEAAAGRPLAMAQGGRPACPSCAQPLKPVQNRTRYGPFAVLECPERHGHLHSHSGLLGERGLVRPLGAAERRALTQEKHRLNCFNCGGRAGPLDDECRWCGTALVVVDLPRLAHSLQVRDEAMGPSPEAPGRHVAWPCRGCGAPLNPGRDAQCPRCHHLVVAHELPDLLPLLQEAEARLAPAAAARAQRQRRAQARYQPGQDRRAAAAHPRLRRLMLFGWLPLLLLLLAAVTLVAGVVSGSIGHGMPPLQALRLQPVAAEGGAIWHWVAPQDAAAKRRLRRAALDLHLRHAAGVAYPPGLSMGQLIDGRYGRAFAPSDEELASYHGAALARSLQLLPASESDPLPQAVGVNAGRFAPAGPGLWVERERRMQGLWAPELQNIGKLPLTVTALNLRMVQGGGVWVGWICRPAQPADGVVGAGQRLLLLCLSETAPAWIEGPWGWAVQNLRLGTPMPLAWRDDSLLKGSRIDTLIDRLVADAQQQGTAPRVKRPTLQERWKALSPRHQWLVGLAALMAGFALYSALARGLGVQRAFIGWMLLALPASLMFGGGLGAASVLLVGMALGLAVIAAAVYTLGFRLYRDGVFQRFERQA